MNLFHKEKEWFGFSIGKCVATDLHFRSRIPQKQTQTQNGIRRINEVSFPQNPSVYTKRTREITFINLLKNGRNLLYVRNQFVPRSKHFPPRL